jgi:hypothetical protein
VTSTPRLPEDAAAEQTYLAELQAQQAATAKRRAEAQRALLASQGVLEPQVPLAPPTEGIAPELLLHLAPEALAQLPDEVQRAVAAVRARRNATDTGAESSPVATTSGAMPQPPDEAAIEAAVLQRVNAELIEGDSPLMKSPQHAGAVQTIGRFLDKVLGRLFSRREPW